jgi:hypothetical protein
MKIAYRTKIIGCLFTMGLFVALHFARAQATDDTGSAVMTDPSTDVSDLSDLAVELKALEMATPIAASNEPSVGNFYSAQHAPGSAEEWPPMPGNIFGLPVWPLDTNIFVIDDLGFRYNESSAKTTKTANGIEAEDDFVVPSPPGGGSDTNTYNPPVLTDLMPDYGTNLFIVSLGMVSGNLTGIASNTLEGVEYAVQTNSDLTTTNWADDGQFIMGSETTNWTQFILPPPLTTNNLFFRLQSEASPDGSGIPLWWETEYFGTNTVDPYSDPIGDGWTVLQDYESSWSPNVYRAPPAPLLSVSYDAFSNVATLNWTPVLTPATSYTAERIDVYDNGFLYFTNTFNLSASTTTLTDTVPGLYGSPWVAEENNYYYSYYIIQAQYPSGNSEWSAPVRAWPDNFASIYLAAGPQNSAYLAIASLPSHTAAVRLFRLDTTAEGQGDYSFDTSTDILVTAVTNGLYLLPPSITSNPVDSYGSDIYTWAIQIVSDTGETNSPATFALNSESGVGNFGMVPPYVDGRAQLKQNLIFLFRAGWPDTQFEYGPPGGDGDEINNPTNYAYAGFIQTPYNGDYTGSFDSLMPFENNYLYRNFVFSLSDVDGTGRMGTGIGDVNYGSGEYLTLNGSPSYQFQSSLISGTNASSVLATNETRWLASAPLDDYGSDFGVSPYSDGVNSFLEMTNNVQNIFGLTFLSAEIAWGNTSDSTNVLPAGGNIEDDAGGYAYPETAQPQFQTVEYDFWQEAVDYGNGGFVANIDAVPGNPAFATTNSSRQFFTRLGSPIQIAGYAKLAVQNGYPGICGYLGQYFDQAYEIGTNGIATTNTTGVLSPYGSFFSTQPGPVALVTMPDVDTGERGTDVVQVISMNVDKNHDGTMDLSFNGPDATSQASPMECWVNDGHDQPGTGGNLDTDLEVPPAEANYLAGQITCPRDLENFFRLWVCGVPALTFSNELSATLTCNVISGSPAINVYEAETNGGTLYLTNTSVAQGLVNEQSLGSVGVNTSGSGTLVFPSDFFDGSNKYLLFEGAGIGEGQFTLTIYQGTNAIAQTSTYIDLHDIEDFYERAVITNNTSGAISNWTSAIETVQPTTANLLGNDTNLIVFVHGFNVGTWNWLDDSDTVLKRLYWAGYQGTFASVKWPAVVVSSWTGITQNTTIFNKSEINSCKASFALKSYLSQLRSRFPNYQLNILAHSQGNVIVGEAIEQGAPFDNYILTQAAMSASSYDVDAPTNSLLAAAESAYATPISQPMGYLGVYTNMSGNIVSFFNTNDSALNVWAADQAAGKPDGYANYVLTGLPGYYSYDGSHGLYNGLISSYVVTDPQESRAMISRALTQPIGRLAPNSGETTQGVVRATVDLAAQFGFTTGFSEHSAEWTRPIQTSLPYYQQILIQIQPIP